MAGGASAWITLQALKNLAEGFNEPFDEKPDPTKQELPLTPPGPIGDAALGLLGGAVSEMAGAAPALVGNEVGAAKMPNWSRLRELMSGKNPAHMSDKEFSHFLSKSQAPQEHGMSLNGAWIQDMLGNPKKVTTGDVIDLAAREHKIPDFMKPDFSDSARAGAQIPADAVGSFDPRINRVNMYPERIQNVPNPTKQDWLNGLRGHEVFGHWADWSTNPDQARTRLPEFVGLPSDFRTDPLTVQRTKAVLMAAKEDPSIYFRLPEEIQDKLFTGQGVPLGDAQDSIVKLLNQSRLGNPWVEMGIRSANHTPYGSFERDFARNGLAQKMLQAGQDVSPDLRTRLGGKALPEYKSNVFKSADLPWKGSKAADMSGAAGVAALGLGPAAAAGLSYLGTQEKKDLPADVSADQGEEKDLNRKLLEIIRRAKAVRALRN